MALGLELRVELDAGAVMMELEQCAGENERCGGWLWMRTYVSLDVIDTTKAVSDDIGATDYFEQEDGGNDVESVRRQPSEVANGKKKNSNTQLTNQLNRTLNVELTSELKVFNKSSHQISS